MLFALFICCSARAQNLFSERLEGRVVSDDKGIADVHVMNTSRSRATITNENGYFAISAGLGDTIIFSAVQYKKKSLVVNTDMLESGLVSVPLEEFVNELDEVILRPYDLSGDLSRDMGQLNTGRIVTASTLGLPNAYVKPISQAERLKFEAVTGAGLIPLNPILNTLTGRLKYLNKRIATEKKYARTDRVREFYPDSLFVRELKIPAAKIDDFMYYCEVDADFGNVVDTHDRLKIWEFLKRKSIPYRKYNDLE